MFSGYYEAEWHRKIAESFDSQPALQVSRRLVYSLSIFGTDWEGTLTASFFGLIGHQVPSSWNLISSTSEQSFRISKNNLHENKKTI